MCQFETSSYLNKTVKNSLGNNLTKVTDRKNSYRKHQRGKNSFNMGLIPYLDDVVLVVVAGVKAPGEHPGHLWLLRVQLELKVVAVLEPVQPRDRVVLPGVDILKPEI